jgi:hypothetical protein
MHKITPIIIKKNPILFLKFNLFFLILFSVIIVINVLTLFATAGPILIFDNPRFIIDKK